MDAVSEVKSRLNIEDVVGQYVQLKRSGRNFKGLSPWTNEKTPSFMVSPEKQIWHDFSSGKGGDMFSFVMEVEGLDFKAALEMLARQAGVDMDQYKSASAKVSGQFKARAQSALELAAKFYQKQLTANQTALKYLLKDRGFSKQTLITWQLGYSPNTGHAVSDFLTKKGFSADEIKRAGLSFMRSAQPADMFRGRIMIPLCDENSQVVGFTARLLADEPDAPKYINTPQTVTYDKGRQVFGLHLAKEAIRKEGCVVVAEGNLDVIASHQAGVANVVASAGTAMTEMHLKQLKRFTSDIRLSFDADSAGIAATERVIPLAQKAEVNLRIIAIKGAKDPDELIKKDVKLWKSAIDSAVYAPDWLIDRYKSEFDLKSAMGKRGFTDALLNIIRRLRDPVEQEHYLKIIAKLTDTTLTSVQAKFAPTEASEATRLRKIKIDPALPDRAALEYQRLQDHFLAMMLSQPKLRPLLAGLRKDFFNEGPPRQLFELIKKAPPQPESPSKAAAKLDNLGDYVKIIKLQFEELYQDLPFGDLKDQATRLKTRLLDAYVKIQKRSLAQTMKVAKNETHLKELIHKVNKLNELISKQ
ncbi:MAG: DNA primase [Candidatus Saccharimonadales bacterium]